MPWKSKEASRAYYRKNRERILARMRISGKRLTRKLRDRKNEIIAKAGKCEKCGFSDLRALVIHHHFGRKTPGRNGSGGNGNLIDIVNHKVPYSILCANCHTILHNQRKVVKE